MKLKSMKLMKAIGERKELNEPMNFNYLICKAKQRMAFMARLAMAAIKWMKLISISIQFNLQASSHIVDKNSYNKAEVWCRINKTLCPQPCRLPFLRSSLCEFTFAAACMKQT